MAAGLRGPAVARGLHGRAPAGSSGPGWWCNWRATPRRAQWVATAKEEARSWDSTTASGYATRRRPGRRARDGGRVSSGRMTGWPEDSWPDDESAGRGSAGRGREGPGARGRPGVLGPGGGGRRRAGRGRGGRRRAFPGQGRPGGERGRGATPSASAPAGSSTGLPGLPGLSGNGNGQLRMVLTGRVLAVSGTSITIGGDGPR